MKKIFALILATLSIHAFAEYELTCWNVHSKAGSKPILKTKIVQEVNLDEVEFDLKNPVFSNYFDTTQEPKFTRKSTIANPKNVLEAEEITSNHSPYKGNNEYTFELGKYSTISPNYKNSGKYMARLILPTDLSAEALKQARLRGPSERMNALLIYTPALADHQSGDNYLKMFCVSR